MINKNNKKCFIKFKVLLLLTLGTVSWAKMPLNDGLYISEGCNVSFEIRDSLGKKLYYSLINHKNSKESEAKISKDGKETHLSFGKLYSTKDKKITSGALVNDKNSFTIQNYGNAMNQYLTFDGCDKYIEYHRVTSVKEIEKKLKVAKSIKKYNGTFLDKLLEKFTIKTNNLRSYNNIAYYLQKHKAHTNALYLLDKILLSFPNRIVAHYNYAENIESLIKQKAKGEYRQKSIDVHYLSYIALMLFEKKEKRIPKKLKQKYAKYFNVIRDLNSRIKEKYQLLDVTNGDINKDKKSDLSLVVELVDIAKIDTRDSFGMRPSNSNKRIWTIFLKKGNKYKFFRKNDKLIEKDESSNCDDNFDGVTILRKSIYLKKHFWCSMGSWSTSEVKYQFIHRDNELIIAGIESSSTNRGTGKEERKSANFLTKRLQTKHITEKGREQGKAKWRKIKITKPIKFQDFSSELEEKLIGDN